MSHRALEDRSINPYTDFGFKILFGTEMNKELLISFVLTFIYLEMPKFNKKEEELEDMFDKWLFVLRNLSCLMERPAALQERIFKRLFEAAEIARFTVEQYREYEESLKVYRDWLNTIETAKNKSHAEGLAEGQRQVTLNMKKMGLSPDIISQACGLSIEEINRL